MVDRGNIQIANTRNPAMYRTEHWGMNVFSTPVPNGRFDQPRRARGSTIAWTSATMPST